MLFSVSTSSWKARLLVPRRPKMDKPLEGCLLAVAPVGGRTMAAGRPWAAVEPAAMVLGVVGIGGLRVKAQCVSCVCNVPGTARAACWL